MYWSINYASFHLFIVITNPWIQRFKNRLHKKWIKIKFIDIFSSPTYLYFLSLFVLNCQKIAHVCLRHKTSYLWKIVITPKKFYLFENKNLINLFKVKTTLVESMLTTKNEIMYKKFNVYFDILSYLFIAFSLPSPSPECPKPKISEAVFQCYSRFPESYLGIWKFKKHFLKKFLWPKQKFWKFFASRALSWVPKMTKISETI